MVSRALKQMSNLLRDRLNDPPVIVIERISFSCIQSHYASEVFTEYQRRANAASKADCLRSSCVSKVQRGIRIADRPTVRSNPPTETLAERNSEAVHARTPVSDRVARLKLISKGVIFIKDAK